MNNIFQRIILFFTISASLIHISTAQTLEPDVSLTYDDTDFGYFTVSTDVTWADAESNCIAWEGHLATIKSAEEDSLLFYSMTDLETYSSCWIDGSTSTYRKFGTLELRYPILNTDFDCVRNRYRALGGLLSNGWANRLCTDIKNCYFCTKPTTSNGCDLIYEESCYRVFEVNDGINWLDAQSSCAVWGGDLTSITTERENNYLYTITESNCWIGLNDRDGDAAYSWTDGTVYSYTNWTNVPSSVDTDCVGINIPGDVSWETVNCEDTRNGFVCKRSSTSTVKTVGRFGELTNGGLGFQLLNGDRFYYNSSTFVCGGEENNTIIWNYSENSDLSNNEVLVATYSSTETGLSWLAVDNTKQGYYQCQINNILSYTNGVYDQSSTTVAVTGTTYTYTVGVDREDVLLLCDTMTSSYDLNSLIWSIQGGSTLNNPINLFQWSSNSPQQTNQLTCASSGITILTNTIYIETPIITVSSSASAVQQFTTVYPSSNMILLQIGIEDLSISTNLEGRWKFPDNTYSSSQSISYAIQNYEYFGLYQFYVYNWDGYEVSAIQINIIQNGYLVTNTISTSSTGPIQNDSTIVLRDNSTVIDCAVSNLGDNVEWYYMSVIDDEEINRTSSSTFSIQTGISSLTVNSNQPGYYSCVINSDMVYTIFAVNIDSLVEIKNFDNPSQQVDYVIDSTISMLYYSQDTIPNSIIRWTTDIVEDGDILTYSVEYLNPAQLSTVFNDVGAGVHIVSCFYRMSPVTLFGSLQLAIKDTATITIRYEGYTMLFSDTNNPMFPYPQEVAIPVGTKDITLTCSLPECVWMISYEATAISMPTYSISELTATTSGNYSLMRVTSTGLVYTTAHISIFVRESTPTDAAASNEIVPTIIIIIIAVVIIVMVLAIILLITIVLLLIYVKKLRKNTKKIPRNVQASKGASEESRYYSNEFVMNMQSKEYIDISEINNREYVTIDETMMSTETITNRAYESRKVLYQQPKDTITQVSRDSAATDGYVEMNILVSAQSTSISATSVEDANRPTSKFIPTKNFPATYQTFMESGMGTDSLFSIEFQKLNEDSNMNAQPEHKEALKARNVLKNPVRNIPPYDENRVVLDSPYFDCNYINASYISDYQFIASIHPTKETLLDFLQMIYQTEASMVIMLTTRQEKTKIISEYSSRVCYWPKKDQPMSCEPFVITLENSIETTAFVKQDISMKNTLEEKEHSFIHCISPIWNEDGTVTENSCVIVLLTRIIKQLQEVPSKSIIIHCEDGISKTGIILTAVNSVKELTLKKTINIFSAVKNLRKQRMKMVPTLACYATCYSLMNEYCTINL